VFDGAVAVIVTREGLGISFHSWRQAVPFVKVGDEIWADMADGSSQCADVVAGRGPLVWEAILRPGRD
jgi:hypothetical protein